MTPYPPLASSTVSGLLSTGAQTIAGAKTFTAAPHAPAATLDGNLTSGAAAAVLALAGNFTTNGAFGTALTATAETALTLPTTGTLAAVVLTTVSFASTVTPVGSSAINKFIFGTQTGNVTIAAPSGTPVDGNELEIRFVIDATGGYTTTFNAIYAFGTDITAALIPTAANSKFMMKFVYVAADSKWRAVAIARGF